MPTSGAGNREIGGRWNSPGSFPVIYTALSEITARAELLRLAARAAIDIRGFLPRRLYTLRVELAGVLDIQAPEALAALGLTFADVAADDPSACQAVGDAAHKLTLEAILAPSASSRGPILAIFELNLRPDSAIQVERYATWN